MTQPNPPSAPASAPAAPPAWALPALVAGFAVLFATAVAWARPAEDAVILYEYSRTLAQTGVVTYGGATAPIEGATDFLWMVLIAGLSAVGVDEYLASLALSGAGAGGLVWLLWRRGAPLVGLAAVALLPFTYAALAGFSPLFFSLVYAGVLWTWLERRHAPFWALTLLLCLIRPDGVVYALGPAVVMFLGSLQGRRWREVGLALGLLVLPGLAYFFGRAAYFGELLPLPFLVKGSGARDLLLFYKGSLLAVGVVALPLVAAGLAARDRLPRLLVVVGPPALFFAVMRLEQNLGNRFLAPMAFGGLLLLAGSRRWVVWAATAGLALLSTKNTMGAVFYLVDSSRENVFDLAHALSAVEGGRMSVTEAGRLAYYSGWEVHDTWGLNTPQYARTFVSQEQLEAGAYDLMNAHCPLEMLLEDAVGTADRTWDNQCVQLTRYIRAHDYAVFLVPFTTEATFKQRVSGGTACQRHDIYALRRGFAGFDATAAVLQAHGAVAWPPDRAIRGDKLCAD